MLSPPKNETLITPSRSTVKLEVLGSQPDNFHGHQRRRCRTFLSRVGVLNNHLFNSIDVPRAAPDTDTDGDRACVYEYLYRPFKFIERLRRCVMAFLGRAKPSHDSGTSRLQAENWCRPPGDRH